MSSTSLIPIPALSWHATPDVPATQFEEELAGDYYEVLRISPRADEETIERVYRTLAERFRPDNPATGDADAFTCITEAYETLSSPARRIQYNRSRHRRLNSPRFRPGSRPSPPG